MFRKTPATSPPPPVPSSPPPARRFTDRAEPAATVLGARILLRGELTSEGPVEIGGTLEGDCRAVGLCRIRPGGRVVGGIRATSILVEGEVSGHSLEAQRVEIGATARVRADIHAERVAIAEGGLFEGKVRMGVAEAPAPVVFREKRGAPQEDGDRKRP